MKHPAAGRNGAERSPRAGGTSWPVPHRHSILTVSPSSSASARPASSATSDGRDRGCSSGGCPTTLVSSPATTARPRCGSPRSRPAAGAKGSEPNWRTPWVRGEPRASEKETRARRGRPGARLLMSGPAGPGRTPPVRPAAAHRPMRGPHPPAAVVAGRERAPTRGPHPAYAGASGPPRAARVSRAPCPRRPARRWRWCSCRPCRRRCSRWSGCGRSRRGRGRTGRRRGRHRRTAG